MGLFPYSKKQQLKKGKRPKRSDRGKISKEEYEKAAEEHGHYCYVCGSTQNIEAHHILFRSNGGRGKWRNLRFLCSEHHRGTYSPHKDKRLRNALIDAHTALYGKWYFADEYDLHDAKLIPNTTKEAFEKFMEKQEADHGQGY